MQVPASIPGGQPEALPTHGFDAQTMQAISNIFGTSEDTISAAIAQLSLVSGTPQGNAIPTSANIPVLQPQNAQASTVIPQTAPDVPGFAQNYEKSFNANLATMASAKNLSQDEVNDLKFMVNNPGVPLDNANEQSKLQGILQQINQNVQSDLTSQGLPFDTDSAGNLVPPSSMQTDFQGQEAAAFDSNFENELNKLVNSGQLSSADAAMVEFAHYNPESTDPAVQNPTIQNALQQTENAAVQDMRSAGFVVPNGWEPPTESAQYNTELSAKFSNSMEAAIQTLGKQQGLTDQQIQSTIYLFFNPGATVGNPALLKEAQTMVLENFGSQLGIPKSFNPGPYQKAYQALLKGNFSQQFQTNLRAMPLTSQQMAQVRAALNNPSLLSGMDPDIKSIIDEVNQQTVSQIQNKFGLPVSWTPDITLSQAAQPNPAGDLVAQGEEMVRGIRSEMGNLPPVPGQQSYLNALLIVGNALEQLKSMVSKMQAANSQIGLGASKTQLSIQLAGIKEQQDLQSKLDAAEKKAGITQAGGLAGMIIACALIAAVGAVLCADPFTMALGIILLVIATVMLVLIIVSATAPNISPGGKTALMVLNIVAEVVAMIIMTVVTFGAATGPMAAADVAGAGGAIGGEVAGEGTEIGVEVGSELGETVIEESEESAEDGLEGGVEGGTQAIDEGTQGGQTVAKSTQKLQDVVDESDESEEDVEEVTIQVNKEVDQEVGKTLMDTLKQGLQKFRQGLKEAEESADKNPVIKNINRLNKIAGFLNDAAQGAEKIQQGLAEAQVALINGQLQALTDITNAINKLMEKFIDLMLGSLSDLGDWMKNINQQEGSMVSSATQSLNGLMRS